MVRSHSRDSHVFDSRTDGSFMTQVNTGMNGGHTRFFNLQRRREQLIALLRRRHLQAHLQTLCWQTLARLTYFPSKTFDFDLNETTVIIICLDLE